MKMAVVYYIVFSQDFAKAFWGEEYIHYYRGRWTTEGNPSPLSSRTPFVHKMCDYHQHKMLDEVQAGREALKYIEKFL